MFSVGQMVVCVDADGQRHLERGRIYEIEGVGLIGDKYPGVDLVGAYNGPNRPGWLATRFRACRKTDISALRDLVARVGA